MAKQRPEDKLLKFQQQQKAKNSASVSPSTYTPKNYLKNTNKPASEKGTREGYTRYTVIANKEQIHVAKAIAWFERKEIKHVIEEALDTYFSQFDLAKILEAYNARENK